MSVKDLGCEVRIRPLHKAAHVIPIANGYATSTNPVVNLKLSEWRFGETGSTCSSPKRDEAFPVLLH